MLPNDMKLNGASPMKPNQGYKSLSHKKPPVFILMA